MGACMNRGKHESMLVYRCSVPVPIMAGCTGEGSPGMGFRCRGSLASIDSVHGI
jgi:hypothetical protein